MIQCTSSTYTQIPSINSLIAHPLCARNYLQMSPALIANMKTCFLLAHKSPTCLGSLPPPKPTAAFLSRVGCQGPYENMRWGWRRQSDQVSFICQSPQTPGSSHSAKNPTMPHKHWQPAALPPNSDT